MKMPKVSTSVERKGMISAIDGNSGVVPSACVSVGIENGKACIDLPIVGKQCINVPSWVPNGNVASICGDICWKNLGWGIKIPAGACATATVAGQQIAHQCFGAC